MKILALEPARFPCVSVAWIALCSLNSAALGQDRPQLPTAIYGLPIDFPVVEPFSLSVDVSADLRVVRRAERFAAMTEYPRFIARSCRQSSPFVIFRFDGTGFEFTQRADATRPPKWEPIKNGTVPIRGIRLIDRDYGLWFDLTHRLPGADRIVSLSERRQRVLTVRGIPGERQVFTVFESVWNSHDSELADITELCAVTSDARRIYTGFLTESDRLVLISWQSDYGLFPRRCEVFDLSQVVDRKPRRLAVDDHLFYYTRGNLCDVSPDGQFLAVSGYRNLHPDKDPALDPLRADAQKRRDADSDRMRARRAEVPLSDSESDWDEQFPLTDAEHRDARYPHGLSIRHLDSLKEVAWISAGGDADIQAAAFSPDGGSLAMTERYALPDDRTAAISCLRVFDLKSGQERARVGLPGESRCRAQRHGLQWLPNRDMLLTGRGEFVDLQRRETIATADPSDVRIRSHAGGQPRFLAQHATTDGVSVLTYEARQFATRCSVNGFTPAFTLADKPARLLAPGDSVAMRCHVFCPADVDKDALQNDLDARICRLLNRHGFHVDDSAEVVVHVSWYERRGEPLPLQSVNRSDGLPVLTARGRDGQPVLATEASVTFDWTDRDRSKIFLRTRFDLAARKSIPASQNGTTTTPLHGTAERERLFASAFSRWLPLSGISRDGEVLPFRMQFDSDAAR